MVVKISTIYNKYIFSLLLKSWNENAGCKSQRLKMFPYFAPLIYFYMYLVSNVSVKTTIN